VELIVLATRNAGKARELEAMLAGAVGRVGSLAEHPDVTLPPEGAVSYRENALEKARAVWRALGVPAVGDDSGLEVDALDGAPGVTSARFAGPDATDDRNNARLLEALRGLPPEKRGARFRCILALVEGGGRETIVEGLCPGRILDAPRGSGGFGYDPLFLPDGGTRSFAELTHAEKGEISHRGRAVAALRDALLARAREGDRSRS
jgi:XTP/dITP diphosphohydrolase